MHVNILRCVTSQLNHPCRGLFSRQPQPVLELRTLIHHPLPTNIFSGSRSPNKYVPQIKGCPVPTYMLQIMVWSKYFLQDLEPMTISLAYPRMHELVECPWELWIYVLVATGLPCILLQLAKHWNSVSKTASIHFQWANLTLSCARVKER